MKKFNLLLLGAAAVFVVSCSSKKLETLPFEEEYSVTQIGDTKIEGEQVPTITFTADGAVYGSTACNRYFGNYTYTDQTLAIDPNMGVTRMMCMETAATEQLFLDNFTKMESVSEGKDGQIILKGKEGEQIIAQKKAAAADNTTDTQAK